MDARLNAAKRSLTDGGVLKEIYVDQLAEKISTVIGRDVPKMARERRSLVEQWHQHMKRQAS